MFVGMSSGTPWTDLVIASPDAQQSRGVRTGDTAPNSGFGLEQGAEIGRIGIDLKRNCFSPDDGVAIFPISECDWRRTRANVGHLGNNMDRRTSELEARFGAIPNAFSAMGASMAFFSGAQISDNSDAMA